MINSRSEPSHKPENGLFSLIIDEFLIDISTLCRRKRFWALHRDTYGNKIVTDRGSIEMGMEIRRLRHIFRITTFTQN